MVSGSGVDVLAAGVVLAVAVAAGTLAHELSHTLALWSLGVPYTVEFAPDEDDAAAFGGSLAGRLASVRPTGRLDRLSPWRLRIVAVMPLTLVCPFVLVPLGVVPDPLSVGDPLVVAAVVGWAGCAIPSPGDFALVWYPGRALDRQ